MPLPHKSDFNEERHRENYRIAGQRLDELQADIDSLVVGPSPSGAAGGALDGTYPNPGLATSVAGDGLTNSSSVLSVNVDGSTIETSSDALRVKDGGITAAKVAADVATQAELDAVSGSITTAITTHDGATTAHAAATNLLHTSGAESKAGILSLTDQMKALGGYSSGGQNYPDIIFDAADLKTGIQGTTGAMDFYVQSGGIQLPALSLTSTYALFGVPLNLAVPLVIAGTMNDGSLGDPYVPTLEEPGYIACFPTTAGATMNITLPDPYNNIGLVYVIADHEGGAATNNIVIACADDFALGTTVEGASSYTISTNNRAVMLRANFTVDYANADWKIIAIK